METRAALATSSIARLPPISFAPHGPPRFASLSLSLPLSSLVTHDEDQMGSPETCNVRCCVRRPFSPRLSNIGERVSEKRSRRGFEETSVLDLASIGDSRNIRRREYPLLRRSENNDKQTTRGSRRIDHSIIADSLALFEDRGSDHREEIITLMEMAIRARENVPGSLARENTAAGNRSFHRGGFQRAPSRLLIRSVRANSRCGTRYAPPWRPFIPRYIIGATVHDRCTRTSRYFPRVRVRFRVRLASRMPARRLESLSRAIPGLIKSGRPRLAERRAE